MIERLSRHAPLVTLVLAAILIVSLAAQKRALETELGEIRLREDRPHAGMLVPAFRSATLDGDSVTIGAARDGVHQVLLFFTTTCPFCFETLPVWKTLAQELERKYHEDVEVYGVSRDPAAETREYAEENGLSFPVTWFHEDRLRKLYRVRGIPLTMVLSADGTVLYARFASLASAPTAIDSIFRALDSAADGLNDPGERRADGTVREEAEAEAEADSP